MLSVRAALLVCLLATAAGMQVKETQDKGQSAENELSEETDPRELEQRAAELQLEMDRLRAEANEERAQMQKDKGSGNVANETSKAADESDGLNEAAKAKKKQQEKDEALIEEAEAKAKDIYRAKRRAQQSVKKAAAEKQNNKAVVEAAKVSKPSPRQARRATQTSAVGDPHLVNMLGQRFDIARPGEHVLIQVPKQAQEEATFLRVVGTVETSGSTCADMYFTAINVTGHWSSRAAGYHFSVRDFIVEDEMKWTSFGPLRLKVVHGHTHDGIQYLNFFVKNLGAVSYHVGGLMGEDDHTYAATPATDCRRILSLLQVQTNN